MITITAVATRNLLGLFAIPLGFAGLGGVWQALRMTQSAPAWPAELAFGISVAIWLTLTVMYIAGGLRNRGSFTADREHTIYGPFAAYIPVIGILLASHYVQYIHNVARGAVVFFVVALAVVAAQLIAHWLSGNVPLTTFHPGYLLPTVAGAFISSIGLSSSGWHQAAESAFGVGLLFWLIIGTLIFGRLFTGAPLPPILKPAMSVLVSPPATAGIAWYILAGGKMDTGGYLILGILLMMILVQVLFFAEYRTLPYSTNFWAFTFPVAASANYFDRWAVSAQFPLWSFWSWTVSAIATAFIAALAAATVGAAIRHLRVQPH
ncbi:TDT family transporter [Streptomyces sp. NPDC001820]|uniref:SLAC1 family transporter n=1 Tax=Streptomyces sp. NPDC001820 TaxID=3364613 RepID=UPI00369E1D4B